MEQITAELGSDIVDYAVSGNIEESVLVNETTETLPVDPSVQDNKVSALESNEEE